MGDEAAARGVGVDVLSVMLTRVTPRCSSWAASRSGVVAIVLLLLYRVKHSRPAPVVAARWAPQAAAVRSEGPPTSRDHWLPSGRGAVG